jgi:beta-aspartyl-dipeptidase (metallo-type)
MSSDGNGSVPLFDATGNTIGVGVASQKSMLQEIRDMIKTEKIAPDTAIKFVTSNVADILKLSQKGQVKESFDADFTVVDKDFQLKHVWARGQHMVDNGQAIVFGTFEQNSL